MCVAIAVAVPAAISVRAVNPVIFGVGAFMKPYGGGFVLYRRLPDHADDFGHGFSVELGQSRCLFFGGFAGGKGKCQTDR